MKVTHHIHCIVGGGPVRDPAGEPLVWGLVSDLDFVRARPELGDVFAWGEA